MTLLRIIAVLIAYLFVIIGGVAEVVFLWAAVDP